MTIGIAHGRRPGASLHEGYTALVALEQHYGPEELAKKLWITTATLRRWRDSTIPGSRCAEVVAMWHSLQQAQPC